MAEIIAVTVPEKHINKASIRMTMVFRNESETIVPLDEVIPSDELPDDDTFQDANLPSLEPFKSLILSLLSQLKLGMDLTRVVLPTFILQSRSFLESLSDFIAPTGAFCAMGALEDSSTREQRFLAVLKWHLSSYYYGCQNALTKKPYNPIMGELFRCRWRSKMEDTDFSHSSDWPEVSFKAEQVTHHPPTSAFSAVCDQLDICMSGYLTTRSKFMGMSLQCQNVGETRLWLKRWNDVYCWNYPTAHARSILTNPFMELGGRVLITCSNGLSAPMVFHTKPFYGGKSHRVTGEIRQGNASVYKFSGEWTSGFEFVRCSDGQMMDSFTIPDDVKCGERLLRPLEKQHPRESRYLWRGVTQAIRAGDLEKATALRAQLEKAQRIEIERMKRNKMQYRSHYFAEDGQERWVSRSVEIPEF